MKSLWQLDLFWKWYLFFTVNLNTNQHNFFCKKIKQIYIQKDNPLLSQVFQPKKTQGKTWKQVKSSDIAYSAPLHSTCWMNTFEGSYSFLIFLMYTWKCGLALPRFYKIWAEHVHI